MKTSTLSDLAQKFTVDMIIDNIKPFGNGYINDTFLITTIPSSAPDYILQRKNHQIFKNVAGMMDNIRITTNHIREQLVALGITEIERKVMTYYSAKNGNLYINDDEGNFWTLFLFIADSKSVESIENPAQAYSAARAFGHFQQQLADLPGEILIETIPNFHNGISRLNDFQEAIKQDLAGRVKDHPDIIEKIMSRSEQMTSLQRGLDSKTLPLRITHNDTKINNILFDQNNEPLCVIDLDTVMPGSALYDFGDAIRSIGNKAPEDEPDLSKIIFNTEIYTAFAQGYLSSVREFLTSEEINNLPFSCRYMAWEQAMRFFTDFINGDLYYKTAYPGHNLVRTKAQMRYLEVLEENRELMEEIVAKG
jgi:Ser/Thr protein kinase RdoA (MazF antagonist)